jgi:hypothetical protein
MLIGSLYLYFFCTKYEKDEKTSKEQKCPKKVIRKATKKVKDSKAPKSSGKRWSHFADGGEGGILKKTGQ